MTKFKIFLCVSLVICMFFSISTMIMKDFNTGLLSLIVVIIGLVVNIIDLIKIRKIKLNNKDFKNYNDGEV